MGYFREEKRHRPDPDHRQRHPRHAGSQRMTASLKKWAEAAGLDVEDIKRGITLTARAAGKSILVTDAYGSVVLSIPSEYQGMEVSVKTVQCHIQPGHLRRNGHFGRYLQQPILHRGQAHSRRERHAPGLCVRGGKRRQPHGIPGKPVLYVHPLRRADADGIQRAFHRADQPHDHAAAPHFGRREKVRRRRFFRPRARGGRR